MAALTAFKEFWRHVLTSTRKGRGVDMKAFLRAGLATAAMFAGCAPAVVAHAGGSGGSKGGSSCNCTVPTPPPCNCNVPTGHYVNVPGVNITPPSVTVNSPNIWISTPNIQVQSAAVSYAQSQANASSSASAQANSNASGNASANVNSNVLSNALAQSNAASVALGSGSSFAASEGASSFIPNLAVEGVETPEARRVCAEFRSVAKVVAVQAVCLDDKAIPHPASQVIPDRDLLPSYEGEVFRCIAGTRMQYTLADYAGSADFGRGQTIPCLKGEALYHAATGQLACRPQRPARDCNERSLLRRYGAGFKVIRAGAQQCVAYRTETAPFGSLAIESMAFDSGFCGGLR